MLKIVLQYQKSAIYDGIFAESSIAHQLIS